MHAFLVDVDDSSSVSASASGGGGGGVDVGGGNCCLLVVVSCYLRRPPRSFVASSTTTLGDAMRYDGESHGDQCMSVPGKSLRQLRSLRDGDVHLFVQYA